MAAVSPQDHVWSLKEQLAERLSVPPAQQRLLYRGKALADDRRLCDYAIGPSSRLNLVLKGAGPGLSPAPSPSGPAPSAPSDWWTELGAELGRRYGAGNGGRVLERVREEYEQSLRALSLDDVERLAARLLAGTSASGSDSASSGQDAATSALSPALGDCEPTPSELVQ
ncbi:ubiquitin-like protein 4A isoform X2 [Coturnix japonica]|uniref:ubiquitin-like protein 4A isoform X2 n=1 Tax=Coturnix japonica TaxID=93934 RepID=UPI000776BE0D|nr:ubiquitin-like protein 4A isoform X2 [Coturnix japonica]